MMISANGQKNAGGNNPVIEGWFTDPEEIIFINEYRIFPAYSAPYDEKVGVGRISQICSVNNK